MTLWAALEASLQPSGYRFADHGEWAATLAPDGSICFVRYSCMTCRDGFEMPMSSVFASCPEAIYLSEQWQPRPRTDPECVNLAEQT